MNAAYSIVAQPSEESVTLLLNGKFGEDSLLALEQSIVAARGEKRSIVMDLSEVTLVDRKAVEYLAGQTSSDVQIVNCPVYLRHWIKDLDD